MLLVGGALGAGYEQRLACIRHVARRGLLGLHTCACARMSVHARRNAGVIGLTMGQRVLHR